MINIESNKDLTLFSSFHTKSSVEFFTTIHNREELQEAQVFAHKRHKKVLFIGNGTNILFPDEHMTGLIIKNKILGISHTTTKNGQNILNIGSGENWHNILKYTKKAKIGAELAAFAGLPGSIGGALVGNAGCFNLELADLVVSIQTFDWQQQKLTVLKKVDLKLAYRHSILKEQRQHMITSIKLILTQKAQPHTQNTLKLRSTKQPLGSSAGSFFKNPSLKQPAGLLIDQAGLKGYTHGGARISPHHANFFINVNHATAYDFIQLRDTVTQAVATKFGINLEPEVRIISLKDFN